MKRSFFQRLPFRLCLFAFGTWLTALAGCASAGNAQRLQAITSRYKLTPKLQDGTNVTFSGSATSMTFEADSRKLLFNGVLVWLNAPAQIKNKKWSVATVDCEHILAPLLQPDSVRRKTAALRVVLDPGHGGKDTGAKGYHGSVEKDLVLDIARRTHRQLSRSGISTKLTRGGDTTLPLSKRVARATQWKTDIFVSIHLNSASNRRAHGLETYVLAAPTFPSTAKGSIPSEAHPGNRHDAASMILAYEIHKGLLKETKAPDRGVRRARFEVIKMAPCPAVLLECGFLSNTQEAAKLVRPDYRERVARALAAAIQSYAKKTRPAK